jgi:hypothetical protein
MRINYKNNTEVYKVMFSLRKNYITITCKLYLFTPCRDKIRSGGERGNVWGRPTNHHALNKDLSLRIYIYSTSVSPSPPLPPPAEQFYDKMI